MPAAGFAGAAALKKRTAGMAGGQHATSGPESAASPAGSRSDEALVRAAVQGGRDAFSELARRYSERLLRFLVLRCGSRADAEDALQDTLVAAWTYLASYDSRWRFSTWIYRIAIRNAGRQRTPAGEGVDGLADERADPLLTCIEQTERENLWLAARRVLSADGYTALWMYYVEELSVADIAMALDRSRTWTKVALMRSRRRLQKEFNHATTD